jgi:hypothetical protein
MDYGQKDLGLEINKKLEDYYSRYIASTVTAEK